MSGLPEVTKDELLDAVKEGVRAAFFDILPYNLRSELLDAVARFPYRSEILNAIADGTCEAMREGRR